MDRPQVDYFFRRVLKERFQQSGRNVRWGTWENTEGFSLVMIFEGEFTDDEKDKIKNEVEIRVNIDNEKEGEFSSTKYIKSLRRGRK